MHTGVVIKNGLQDFQIIQQENGYGHVRVSGTWSLSDPALKIQGIYIRVLREDSGEVVLPWVPCEIYGKNRWRAALKKIPAGGLYRVETAIDHSKAQKIRGDMVHHIGVGDLFVIAGQSNAAGYGRDPIYDPPEIGVHVHKNSGKWDLASHPLSDSTGSKWVENRDMGIPGHSPYLCFAKILKRELGYPIGLIPTAIGGSPLSRWNPDEDGYLYANMIKRIKLAGGRVKAMLWYQGCADADGNTARTYLRRFEGMVNHLRSDLKNRELPVFTVQVNRYIVPSTQEKDRGWGMLREAQRKAAKMIPNVFIVPASDCTISDAIHNSAATNIKLGERLAKSALSNIYLRDFISEAPNITKAVKLTGSRIELWFENVKGKLYAFEVGPDRLPFTVVDEKGKIGIKGYEISGSNRILLELEREPVQNCVIHGVWEQNPEFFAPIDDFSYLPILSFYGVEIE